MAAFLLLCPAPSVFSSLFPSRRGTTTSFLLLCPAPSVFSSLFPSWRGTMAAFLLLCPAPSVFSSLFPSRRGTMASFLLLCPTPWIFLLSLSYDQNPVTSLDLISGHTIGLPKGCHRHIIPLSNIPQAVTLTYYINSQ